MDFLSAFSGLERIAIIAGAMLVGFWGYRLFATDRTPALVFMGISCLLLFGTLFTGGSHVKNIGTSYQLATASAAVPAPQVAEPEVVLAVEAAASQPPADADDPVEPVAADESQIVEQVAVAPQPLELAPVPATIRNLLSSQELGGRIVSVKSESITLEWAPRDG